MADIARRVRRLEAGIGGGSEGCDRCCGTLFVVSNAVSGEFHSASWNGEPLGEHDAHEHETERKCPRCGRRLDPGERPEIRIGGRRRS